MPNTVFYFYRRFAGGGGCAGVKKSAGGAAAGKNAGENNRWSATDDVQRGFTGNGSRLPPWYPDGGFSAGWRCSDIIRSIHVKNSLGCEVPATGCAYSRQYGLQPARYRIFDERGERSAAGTYPGLAGY